MNPQIFLKWSLGGSWRWVGTTWLVWFGLVLGWSGRVHMPNQCWCRQIHGISTDIAHTQPGDSTTHHSLPSFNHRTRLVVAMLVGQTRSIKHNKQQQQRWLEQNSLPPSSFSLFFFMMPSSSSWLAWHGHKIPREHRGLKRGSCRPFWHGRCCWKNGDFFSCVPWKKNKKNLCFFY